MATHTPDRRPWPIATAHEHCEVVAWYRRMRAAYGDPPRSLFSVTRELDPGRKGGARVVMGVVGSKA